MDNEESVQWANRKQEGGDDVTVLILHKRDEEDWGVWRVYDKEDDRGREKRELGGACIGDYRGSLTLHQVGGEETRKENVCDETGVSIY